MKLIDEIKNIESSGKQLKQFGLLFGGIFLLLAVISYSKREEAFVFAILAAAFILPAYLFPKVLVPLHKIWMSLAVLLGFISTRVILFLLFYFIVTPIKFFVKKDLLDEKLERKRESYWAKRENRNYEKSETERQF